MNGYNFTERVRHVLSLAREEASDLHHEYVGTEHILLGVIREGDGVASVIITNFGVDYSELRSHIIEIVRPGAASVERRVDLPYTSRAKKTLEYAMKEAQNFNHSYVGTEHLLLGLLHEGKGIGAQVLHDVGITLEGAREETLRVLGVPVGTGFAKPGAPSPRTLTPYPQRLREVFARADDIAAERGSIKVTPAHVMIALLEHRDGMANMALDRLNIDRMKVIFALNDLAPHAARPVSPDRVVKPSQSLMSSLAAMRASQRDLHAPVPGTQHLLLGILSTSPDIAAVFQLAGLTYEAIQAEIRRGSG
jgi:ATP-dependent Clp protease ATP-binding subunit ClpA